MFRFLIRLLLAILTFRVLVGLARFALGIAGAGSATRVGPGGRKPAPGGWNRLVVEVPDLEARVGAMKRDGITFRNDIVSGPGGKQILVEDGCGNVVELFQPA